jgi:predicted RNA-binding Zn-ribbon protein involved in translation (DUF1610 family)
MTAEQVIADAISSYEFPQDGEIHEAIAAALRAAGLLPGPDDIVVSRKVVAEVLSADRNHSADELIGHADCLTCAAHRRLRRAALSQPHPAESHLEPRSDEGKVPCANCGRLIYRDGRGWFHSGLGTYDCDPTASASTVAEPQPHPAQEQQT